MDTLKSLLKLEFLTGARTYIGIASLWMANIAEWNGFDVPGFTAMSPVDLLAATMIALGLYEKVKANS